MHAAKNNENNENTDRPFFKDNHWSCVLKKHRRIKKTMSKTKNIKLVRTSFIYEKDFNRHIFKDRCRDRGKRINNKMINLMAK
jgi:hypothetical protein